ncbi:MAG TPA: ATP-binding protein [Jatrophihabitans sp.]|nr:ATP-binding protein [Jatrophihabitans sp.]
MGVLAVAHDPVSAAFVRRSIAADLTGRGLDQGSIDDVVLVASELVTNAVLHAPTHNGSELDISWEIEAQAVVVRVLDDSPTLPHRRSTNETDNSGRGLYIVAELHYAISERLSIDELLTRVTALPRDDRWSTLARSAARHDVYAALSAITTAVLQSTDDKLGPDERIDAWMEQNVERVERARSTVRAALDRDVVDLATLSVALRVLRGLPS